MALAAEPTSLDLPLHEVTFVVLDTETTGGSPATAALTELAAAKFRAGECLGTFQSLINPGTTIPGFISALTGITDDMVERAPPVSAVLPSFLEFVRGTVLVGHNLRFDLAFLDSALVGSGRPPLPNRMVDTLSLARRLVRDDVPDCRLHTLAWSLRLEHRPSHRALDDVFATADLLHQLIERASGYGVSRLHDLVELPRAAAHPQAAKLALTDHLPAGPGVYWLEDARGALLFVGATPDLRGAARSHFVGTRRAGLLERLARVGHLRCSGMLEAAVIEARLLEARRPPYNRAHAARRPTYVVGRRNPCGWEARTLRARNAGAEPGAGAVVVGPFPSPALARDAAAAWERGEASGAAMLERYLVRRRRAIDLHRAGTLVVGVDGEGVVRLDQGLLREVWTPDGSRATALEAAGLCPVPWDGERVPVALARELAVTGAWLASRLERGRARVLEHSGPWDWPGTAMPAGSPVAEPAS